MTSNQRRDFEHLPVTGHWSPVTFFPQSSAYLFPLDFSTAPPYDSRTMTGKERRYLRGLAHGLSPVVTVGQRGPSDAVVRQVDDALTDHELIKVRVGNECPADRSEVGATLTERTRCELAGTVGRVLILYRAHPERPRIVLPGAVGAERTDEA